ncbi:alpha/beta hydrolase [Micromonospora haikouensis]|uniref:alpha/beta hydrolase n=1 Tax=Micromonospora haikouensis TaxID=686309 RepID=UPI0037BA2FCA
MAVGRTRCWPKPSDWPDDVARRWGSELVDLGDAGHMTTADGYGPGSTVTLRSGPHHC